MPADRPPPRALPARVAPVRTHLSPRPSIAGAIVAPPPASLTTRDDITMHDHTSAPDVHLDFFAENNPEHDPREYIEGPDGKRRASICPPPPPPPPASTDKPSTDDLLKQLVETSLGPLAQLRDSINLTLDEVSHWIRLPENRGRISGLVELLDAQTQLLICQHRVFAGARLAEVASGSAGPETIRRACADLLKIRLINPYLEDKRPEKIPPVHQSESDQSEAIARYFLHAESEREHELEDEVTEWQRRCRALEAKLAAAPRSPAPDAADVPDKNNGNDTSMRAK